MKLIDRATKILEIDRIHLKLDKDFGSINKWHIVHSERFRISVIADNIDKECNEAEKLQERVKSSENKIILLIGMYLMVCLAIAISRGL